MQDWQYNQQMYDAFQEQIDKYPELKRQLGEMSENQMKLLLAQYQNKQEELGFETSESLYDFMTKYQGAQGRSGFAGSGALERGRERGMGSIQKGFEFGSQSLFDWMKQGKLDITKDYWSKSADLDKWRSDLQMQQTQLDTKPPTVWDRLWSWAQNPMGAFSDWADELF